MKKFTVGLSLSVALTSFATPSGIQAAESEAYTQLDEVVVVASKIATPYSQVAATVTTVDAVDIENLAATDFRDIAQSLPGLSMRRDASRFGLDAISVRGIGGNRVAVLIDGVPVSKGFAVGNYSDSGRPLNDLDNVRRVEILRGPASALYGSAAIGGVVSIATFDPSDLLRDADGEIAARVRIGYDNRDEESHAGFDLASDIGPLQGLIGYTHRKYGELDTTGWLPPNPRDGVSDAMHTKLVWADAPGGRMRLMANVVKTQTDTVVNSLTKANPLVVTPNRFANTTSLLGDDSSKVVRFALDQSLRVDTFFATSGEWRVYWSQVDTLQLSDELRTPAPPTAPTRIQRSFNVYTSQWGSELTLSRHIDSGMVQQQLVYGIEAIRSTVRELRDGLQTNLNTGVVTNNVLGEILPVRDFPPSRLLELGAYLQNDIRIGEHWSFIPALRFDYYDLAPKPDAIYLQDNASTSAVSVTTRSWTPKLGVVYAVGDDFSVFAQYAHGFRAPPFEDVNIGLDIPSQNIRAIPNPDLKPEKSNGYEVGVRAEGNALMGSASFFYNDYTDFIEPKVNLCPTANARCNPATGPALYQSQNIAQARIYGVELDGSWQLDSISDALTGWRLRLAATWTQGDDLVRDQPLNSVDPAQAIVAVGYRAAAQWWAADLAATTVAAKSRVADPTATNAARVARTGSYTVVDLYSHFTIADRLKLDIALLNLLDRSYQVWADVRGRAVNDPQLPLFFQPGRSIAVTLKWQL